jgi:alpha-1,3-fucosyltransferase
LAFENTLCKDYITEKVYRSMKHMIIPVVYGGAHYWKFLPPHSYINVNDFKSIQELADHLKYLSANPEEYVKYFWWKKHYKIVGTLDETFCNLCQTLHDPVLGKREKIYNDIDG